MNTTFRSWQARVEQNLTDLLQGSSELMAAMRYATLNGGKRFRPLLVYASGLSVGAKLEDLDCSAMAVELIHAYSLVHDDLPAMDDDDLRRGQPTCHIKFGEALAILAGDAMQALAFEILTSIELSHLLAKACGAEGMAGGQALDLAVVGRKISLEELKYIHALKTGALIKASILMGANVAKTKLSALQWTQLSNFADLLGLVYQVQDDIFDVELSTEQRGKRQGADAEKVKPTFPALMGLAEAKNYLQQLSTELLLLGQKLNFEKAYLLELTQAILAREI